MFNKDQQKKRLAGKKLSTMIDSDVNTKIPIQKDKKKGHGIGGK